MEEIRTDNAGTIRIYTIDGRVVEFEDGKYTMNESDSGWIQGKGKLFTDKAMHRFEDYEEKILLAQIQKMTVYRGTIFGEAGALVLGALGMAIVLLMLFPPSISAH